MTRLQRDEEEMFAKLKKKIAEEAATAPRTGARIPRSASKESITSGGADSGDDFASDGSSSRDDLSSQVLRRNDQVRRLEAKLTDYAEQLRILQKTKEKVEFALEKHQDSSMRKLQEQNESNQAGRAKMAEGLTLALEKRDQEWMEKMGVLEKEKEVLRMQVEELTEKSLTLFQKRDDRDELETFQQQELAKVKHMLLRKEEQLSQREKELEGKEVQLQAARRSLAEAQGRLLLLGQEHQEISQLNTELEIEREELLVSRDEAESKVREAEQRSRLVEHRGRELQAVIQQVSEDFQKSQALVSCLERSLYSLQTEHNNLKLQQHKAEVVEEDHASTLSELQAKVVSLERRLQQEFSLDQHLQGLMEEKREVEQRLEKAREDLLEARTSHADTVSSLEAQVSMASGTVGELQTLIRHKEDSSKSYRERTDAQITALEQQVVEARGKVQRAEREITELQDELSTMQTGWLSEKASLDQQLVVEKQLREDTNDRLEQEKAIVKSESQTMQEALCLRMREVEEDKRCMEEEKRSLEEARRGMEEERDKAFTSLQARAEELTAARAELVSRQTVSVEIAMALEDSRRQKEELQAQVGDLLKSHDEVQQKVTGLTNQLAKREEQITMLKNDLEASRGGVVELQAQVQAQLEGQRAQAKQQEAEKDQQLACLREDAVSQLQLLDSCQSRISFLEVEVETLTEQLQPPDTCVPPELNGAVTVDDLDLLQKTNRDLEQQLADKNRTIKQLQQRLAELKRTFQKELKLKPDLEPQGRVERAAEDRGERQDQRPSSDPLATTCTSFTTSSPAPPPGPAPLPGLATPRRPTSTCTVTVTNTSDLNDSREINFEYLKHVVLKFMSCREAEAFHLIRAVSVLLNFTREEEDLLKKTLEYKMSWFGSKPSPKGSIRPSISGAAAQWS
ncbi:golgin subfamily A member 1 isoform X2 [Gadus morhua]|uniref:golgin subfamily A member 1 isoform X2 n=1 Tax=Gadus morhua TaxID=8049 RepID=UPI0011B47CF5|nr:golgin subfamily A member 1 isoform X2 [Gadus morhua]